jgi:hypothetical protein
MTEDQCVSSLVATEASGGLDADAMRDPEEPAAARALNRAWGTPETTTNVNLSTEPTTERLIQIILSDPELAAIIGAKIDFGRQCALMTPIEAFELLRERRIQEITQGGGARELSTPELAEVLRLYGCVRHPAARGEKRTRRSDGGVRLARHGRGQGDAGRLYPAQASEGPEGIARGVRARVTR